MKVRKKPIEVEAFLWTGDKDQIEDPEWIIAAIKAGIVNFVVPSTMLIATPEGTMKANVGDYIIRGVNGEIYPCEPDAFEKTYDIVEHAEVE